MRYNDASVLESHHCAAAFASLGRTGLLASLAPQDWRRVRRTMVTAILATDSACRARALACVLPPARSTRLTFPPLLCSVGA